jgi:hypothetical protein
MEDVTVGKDGIEALGLKEPLDRMKVLAYMRKFRVMPYWSDNRGLFFRPHIGRDARQRFQEVLDLYGREDVQRVRHELRQGSPRHRQEFQQRTTKPT